jgi:hypothetical protein
MHVPQVESSSPSLEEVDEALHHLSQVPRDQRGTAWWAYADAMLTERDLAKLLGDEEISDG